MTTDEFFTMVERVFATWHYDHPRILYALMRSLKPKVSIEVGTYRGYAACYMAQAHKENGVGHLYCIDDFSEGMQQNYGEEHWKDNIEVCGVQGYVSLLRGRSDDVKWPNTVDFAYIDGWHGYTTVRADFISAAERGAECICLDDVTSTVGPSLFVGQLQSSEAWDVMELFRDCGLAVCVRRRPRPPCNFSQELPGHPGTVMTGWTDDAKRGHLADAARITRVDYSGVDL